LIYTPEELFAAEQALMDRIFMGGTDVLIHLEMGRMDHKRDNKNFIPAFFTKSKTILAGYNNPCPVK
jgi:hypothetical protein